MEKPENTMVDEISIAWAAGFFDGEGSVSIYSRIRKRKNGRRVYEMRCMVTQKYDSLLWLLKAYFGGAVRPHGVNTNNGFCWTISQRKAERFLQAIRPYTHGKTAQIDVALEFMSRRIPVGQGSAINQAETIQNNLILDENSAKVIRSLKQVSP